MKQATVELNLPGTNRGGKAILDRELLKTLGLEELERRFAATFADAEDEARLELIGNILKSNGTVLVDALPGENTPPEYHVYIRDPHETEDRLFACVLAPEALAAKLLLEAPYVLFENATFQSMPNDTSPAGLQRAIETWVSRIFPDLKLPRIVLRPWPIREVIETRETPKVPRQLVGVSPTLDAQDYPIPEELSA